MSENDYIAEYVRERFPALLGTEFVLWKMARQVSEVGKSIVETLRQVDWRALREIAEESEDRA